VTESTQDPVPGEPETPSQTSPTAEPASEQPVFTKAPQPELSLEARKQKAGWNKNRIGIWIVVGGFGAFLIIQGIVGILTKAR
jgi:hypothetical protein